MSPALTDVGCRQRDDTDPSPRWPVFLLVVLALLGVLEVLHATGLVWIEQTIERLTRVLGTVA